MVICNSPGCWRQVSQASCAEPPDLNAYVERFVLSIKSKCLMPLGERHFGLAATEFVEHAPGGESPGPRQPAVHARRDIGQRQCHREIRPQRAESDSAASSSTSTTAPSRSGKPLAQPTHFATAPAGAPDEPCALRLTCGPAPDRSRRRPCRPRRRATPCVPTAAHARPSLRLGERPSPMMGA